MRALPALFLLAALIGSSVRPASGARPVRVGLVGSYAGHRVHRADGGSAAAETRDRFLMRIVGHIAIQEDWSVTYGWTDLHDAMDSLETGRLDLVVGIPRCSSQPLSLDCSQETAISTWAQAYAPPRQGIQSAVDLAGRSVGLVHDDPVFPELRALVEQFGLRCDFVEFADPDDLFAALGRGWVEAAIVDRFYGSLNASRYGLEATPVLLSPVELHVAAAKGRNRDLLATVDYHLAGLKKDPTSAYYRALDELLGRKPESPYVRYLAWGMAASVALLLAAVGITVFLRHTVRRQTAQLRTVNQSLEREMARRREAEQSLRQAAKMEAIGTMAGGIAHDFNNILTPIIGFTELALQTQDRDAANRFLDGVAQAAHRARDLVAQILTFSRQTETLPRPLRLTPVVKEVLKLLRASLPADIDVQFRCTADDDLVVADPTQIHQVMMNLATNAAHAMQATGGTLEVVIGQHIGPVRGWTGAVVPEAGPWVRLSVRDTGVGIDPGVRERLFEPFFTTKPPGEGTGMGLAVVHGIVRNYGGTVDVESAAGRGSTFHVYLPRARRPESRAVAAPAAEPRGTGERVLVVDDDVAIVEMARAGLAALGYTAVGFSCSRTALSVFKADPQRFDVVVTDHTMPGVNGLELARQVLRARPELPVVLCTGLGEEGLRAGAEEAGVRQCVGKPLGPRQLAAAIRRALDGGAAAADREAGPEAGLSPSGNTHPGGS